MRALILGGGGQIGRALLEAAPSEVRVHAASRAECDITNEQAVEQILREAAPDILFNAAAYTAVDEAESEPERAALINGRAPGWIARIARDHGARTIQLSTDFVFDGRAGRPYAPGDSVAPLSVYGRTKRMGEEAVLAADLRALVVRTAWVHSRHGRNFVRSMLRLMREGDHLTIVADQIGTPTYAPSLAAALWALARSGALGIHQFTDAGVASWYDFAVAIREESLALGLLDRSARIVPVRTRDYPTAAARPLYSVLDKTETWRRLGAVPAHWRENLRLCLQEIARNG